MRILNRKKFLALKGQHLFAKYQRISCNSLAIKIANCGSDDFLQQDLDPIGLVDIEEGSIELFDKCHQMESNDKLEAKTDYYCGGRDGLYDPNQLFMVFSKQDVLALIKRLFEIVR